jgi:hypothetical protein
MMVEVGDMSDLGEAWVRYQGNRVISDFAEVMGSVVRADVTGALRRAPKLIEFYDIDPAELDDGYLVGGCWVFRVCSE